MSAYSDSVCTSRITVSDHPVGNIDITLRSPHLMPHGDAMLEGHSRLFRLPSRNFTVLHLKGSAFERGFAHGKLLAQQIVDMIDFFLIEDMLGMRVKYYDTEWRPALRNKAMFSHEFHQGVEGVIAGMKAAGVTHSVTLQRPIDFFDIVALNSYAGSDDWTAKNQSGPRLQHSSPASCSQFVFWGESVDAKELHSGTIAGRNMDGEIDVRKLTVTHLVVFAIEPTEQHLSKYAHVLWPGFVGASSGFNEFGQFLMENAGCNPPGASAAHTFLLRDLISGWLLRGESEKQTIPSEFLHKAIEPFKSSAGGACVNGCILIHAEPNRGGRDAPGFVYEGDRNGGEVRLAATSGIRPAVSDGFMATNHFLQYKFDPAHPDQCNGSPVSFSSLARYWTGGNRMEGIARGSPGGLRVNTEEMKRLLQATAHGSTEHSIIFRPNMMTGELAVARVNGVWDAPYLEWQRFSFKELFPQAGATQGEKIASI